MRRKLSILLAVLCMVLLGGCQSTPEESAVVSRSEGFDPNLVAETFKSGEEISIEVPAHWSASESGDNEKMTINAELDFEPIVVGNLPVLEMERHRMTEEELEKLVLHFSKGKELFKLQMNTKDTYQEVIDRMENQEGAYAEQAAALYYMELKKQLQEAKEVAPETVKDEKITEIGFEIKQEDESLNIAKGRGGSDTGDAKIYFAADIGSDRWSYIEAETYDADLKNDSSFLWKTGEWLSEERIQEYIRGNEYNNQDDETGYLESYRELLEGFVRVLDKDGITQETGREQAELLMEELEMPEMSMEDCDRVLWFPNGAMPELSSPGTQDDFVWQADLTQAESGYIYTFTRNIGGLFAKEAGAAVKGAGETYAPPFPIEMVQIVVTQNGIMEFRWQGMSEEVSVMAENTRLCDFEKIKERLFEQILYWYTGLGVPQSSDMKFSYEVVKAELGYTYITAYEKPERAWLVPAWSFEVMEQVNGNDLQIIPHTLNALDGGVVSSGYMN